MSRVEKLGSLTESIKITPGMAKVMMKGAKVICKECGLGIPTYPGRNPSKCPNCGATLISTAEYQKAKQDKVKKSPEKISQLLGKVLDSGTPFPTKK